MQTLVAWILMLLILLAAYGWSAWLLTLDDESTLPSLVLALTLALSVGGLTLVMFWLSLFGVPLNTGVVAAVYVSLMLPGWWLWISGAVERAPGQKPPLTYVRLESALETRGRLFALFLLVAVAAAVIFNAVYWPFSRDDALGIYHAQAVQIADKGAILPLTGADSLYLAYPALMPLAYAFTYLASGWHNEYLARLIPALMSVGCLMAAFTVGKTIRGSLAGWLGALALAVTPTFGRWASAGYVDLPVAFYYTLSALFAVRLWRSNAWKDALLAGAMMGLAAWTKNAALIGIELLGVVLLWGIVLRRISIQNVLRCALTCATVAAPWYIRNLLGAGFLLPDTAWTEDARASVENLLILVQRPEIYGVSGWVMMAGIAAALVRFIRNPRKNAADVWLLVFTLPFFVMWWVFASYDPRFLLLVLPLWCALAGILIADVVTRLPRRIRLPLALAGGALLLVLSAQAVWNSVEFKPEILRNPFMTDADKHAIVLRGRVSGQVIESSE